MPIGDTSCCYVCGRDCNVNGETVVAMAANGKFILETARREGKA